MCKPLGIKRRLKKRYSFRLRTMWGRCHGCLQPLNDSDYIYGTGKYCDKCDCERAIRTFRKIIRKVKSDLGVNSST